MSIITIEPGSKAPPLPWEHQKDALGFLETRRAAMLAMAMGCVDGEAVLQINRAGFGRRITIAEAYRKFHRLEGFGSRSWDPAIPTFAKALCDGELRQHRVLDILDQGVKSVVRLTLASGKSLRLTPDHEVALPGGRWLDAESLSAGMKVLCNGQPACRVCSGTKKVTTYRYAKHVGVCRSCIAKQSMVGHRSETGRILDKDGYVRVYRQHGHHRANVAGQVYEHILVMEQMLGRPVERGEIIHHLNENKADNRPENLELVGSQKEHSKSHQWHLNMNGGTAGRGGRVIFIPTEDEVVSVEPDGVAHVYDLVMEGPHHNFVANGIVVHNCGKSFVVVRHTESKGFRRVLIICPKSVVNVWPSEFRKHAAGLWRVLVLDSGTCPQKAREVNAAVRDVSAVPLVVVCNYESAYRAELAREFSTAGFQLVVYDEIHKIKAAGGRMSQFCHRLSKRIPFRLGLTGTPFAHSPLDIYGQFRALDWSVFGTSNTLFRAEYAVMGGFKGREVIAYQNMERLASKMRPLTFKIDASVLRLAEPVHTERYCELGDEARRVYRSLERDLIAEIEAGTITASNALAKLLRLRQITSGFAKTEDGVEADLGNHRRELLAEVLEEIEPHEPVVVFGVFRRDLDTIRDVAEKLGRSTSELSGRHNDLAAWQQGRSNTLAVQIQSGGVGIDLTRAAYCIYFSVGFSLGDFEQSLARVQRPGQTRQVVYVHLVARKSVDEVVYRALRNRADVVRSVLSSLTHVGHGAAA